MKALEGSADNDNGTCTVCSESLEPDRYGQFPPHNREQKVDDGSGLASYCLTTCEGSGKWAVPTQVCDNYCHALKAVGEILCPSCRVDFAEDPEAFK
jgi:hypothetical protein